MKKILLLPFLFLVIWITNTGFIHPLYVSVSQISYNTEAKSLEIACKIFVDDLESALKGQGAGSLNLGLANEDQEADKWVDEYLSKHINIEVNGEALEGSFIGKEVQDDVIWSYIEITGVSFPNEFTIENTLLIEELEGQQNIIHVRVSGKEKSLRLFEGRTKEVLNF